MLVVRALYGLKSSGAAFRALLAETLYDLNYRPTKADPDYQVVGLVSHIVSEV